MRESIKQFVKICAETLPFSEPVYEFGSFQVPGQEGFADLRPLFPDKKYVGADMRQGPGVDLVLNLHNINLPSESVGTVLLMDTLEHVELPRKAIEEVHRILKPNGTLIISSVMNFPIHDYPYDYWRFTPEAFRSLLKPFTSCFVDFAGESVFPHTVVGIGFKGGNLSDMGEFIRRFKRWKEYWRNPSKAIARDWKRLAKIFAPPILFTIIQRLDYNKPSNIPYAHDAKKEPSLPT
jgi:SAM-dependent methyltransferase